MGRILRDEFNIGGGDLWSVIHGWFVHSEDSKGSGTPAAWASDGEDREDRRMD